jgi:hypothetical protein
MNIFGSFWGSVPEEESKKAVLIVNHTASTLDKCAKQQLTERTSQTHDKSAVSMVPIVKVTEGDKIATVTDAEIAVLKAETVDENLATDLSLENTLGSSSFGEETAAAVLEELEHQDQLERQEHQQIWQHGGDLDPKPTSDFAGDEEEVDFLLVEQYDNAFNEFIYRNPKFLVINPDLVHSLRVLKLQKILERQDKIETELFSQLESVKTTKRQMEAHYQSQLKDAARRKAARGIHWQAHLEEIQHSTKVMEGQLTWDVMTASEHWAKEESAMLQELPGMGYGRHALATLVPDGPEFEGIRDAMMAPPNLSNQVDLNEEQLKDLRQFQMDNAFLNAEVSVLQKKLGYQDMAKKKHAWVESVLVRMDKKTLKKLKVKYQKKTGVQV